MTRFIASRLVITVIVIASALIITITVLNIFREPALLALPVGSTQAQIHEFNVQNGLTGNTATRIVRMTLNALRGDFGTSTWLQRPALRAALQRLPTTLQLAVPAILIAGIGGVAIGGALGRRPGGRLERVSLLFTFLVLSLPEFWIAILGVSFISVRLGLLPTGGPGNASHLVLPIIVLMLRPLAQAILLTRASVLDEVEKSYVLTAWAKGMTGRSIFKRHVRRNAIVPVTTVLFYDLARMFAGTVIVVETLFSWPGLGQLSFEGLTRGDPFLIAACVFIGATVTASLNLVADISVLVIDRKARMELAT